MRRRFDLCGMTFWRQGKWWIESECAHYRISKQIVVGKVRYTAWAKNGEHWDMLGVRDTLDDAGRVIGEHVRAAA